MGGKMDLETFISSKRTRKCMTIADDVFGLFDANRLGRTDGMFTLAIALARCIQTECETTIEREAMVLAITQIMTRAAVTLDETLAGVIV
jgi:hypothetical protein